MKNKVTICLIVILTVCLVLFFLLLRCYISGEHSLTYNNDDKANRASSTPLSSDSTKSNSINRVTDAPKNEEKGDKTTALFQAKRPYYGMSEQYIDSTDIGAHDYVDKNVATPQGTMDYYTYYIDSDHAMLVKTQKGAVIMVQYFENSKILWSETKTGYHSFSNP